MKSSFNPVSTYRVQFNKEFTFSDFEKIIPYLDELGIRTIYASPIFEASPGSMHGYDGIDPNKINPEIGTPEQLYAISDELKKRNIHWVQDIVPNHLAFHQDNKWLMDVLEKGRHSAYASTFDILWDHPDYPGKLMVPFPGSELEKELRAKFPDEKNFVLCSWQETDFRMNYRRFFLVNSLICTNIHLDDVFQRYHQLVSELTRKGVFSGLRVDHIDGLYDPTKYLRDLRELAGDNAYIVVEKILEHGEQMPAYWPIQGNSGYDFLGIINNALTNSNAKYELTALYYDITGDGTPVNKQVLEKKKMILHSFMRGELNNLVRLYRQITHFDGNDEALSDSIATYLVNCPVYRYYEEIPMMEMDASRDANQMRPFYQRCMQFTGPLMAKGVEDTLMYTYNRFIGHNEVGDSPEFFGYSTEEFHRLMQERNSEWPLGMNASSTHDTKRGEDVRARLNALTALHNEWVQLVKQWQQANAPLKKNASPDSNDEYFIYQTLAGSYPILSRDGITEKEKQDYKNRITEYLQKSMREAKLHSSWTKPDEEYENATISFAHQLIEGRTAFQHSFIPFLRKLTDFGMINSFVQVVLKCCCPGIPDVYQGTEFWDLSLVDPDNRRPVDYVSRQRYLSHPRALHEWWEERWNGAVKLHLLHRLLNVRNLHKELFADGRYLPLQVEGKYHRHILAFARSNGKKTCVVVVPLHYALIKEYHDTNLLHMDWEDTRITLPQLDVAGWTDVVSDNKHQLQQTVPVNDLFKSFIVAVLVSD